MSAQVRIDFMADKKNKLVILSAAKDLGIVCFVKRDSSSAAADSG